MHASRCKQRMGVSGQHQSATIPARVYAITPENVLAEDNATDVVTGIIPLLGRVACVFFNPGATHSFILSSYVKLCRVNTELLE